MTWKRRTRSRGMLEDSEVAVSDGEAAPELPEAGVEGTMHDMCSFSPITWGKHHKQSVSNAVAGNQDMHMIRLSVVHVYMAAPQTSDSSASNNSEDLLDTGIVWNCWTLLYILPLALRS